MTATRRSLPHLSLSPFVGAGGQTIRPNRAGVVNPVNDIPIFWAPIAANPTRRLAVIEKITDDERIKCRSLPALGWETPTGRKGKVRDSWMSPESLAAMYRPIIPVDLLNLEEMERYGLGGIQIGWCRENVETFPDPAKSKEYADVHALTNAIETLIAIRTQKADGRPRTIHPDPQRLFADGSDKVISTLDPVEVSRIVEQTVRALIPEIASAVFDALTGPSVPSNNGIIPADTLN